MFIKSTLAKFEWRGQPDELPSVFIERLLLHSSSYNFAVVKVEGKTNADENGEIWAYYSILDYEPKYRRAKEIQIQLANGGTYATTDFVLFNNFKNDGTLNSDYIRFYSQMIQQINKALRQHIQASQLVATIYCNSDAEATEAEKAFADFKGVKVLKKGTATAYDGSNVSFIQFDIQPRLLELQQLKGEIERDLFQRLGIASGIDKSHLTEQNTINNDESADLLNCYELDLRKDFCKRYNAWKGKEVLSVSIRKITADNSINDYVDDTGGTSNDG